MVTLEQIQTAAMQAFYNMHSEPIFAALKQLVQTYHLENQGLPRDFITSRLSQVMASVAADPHALANANSLAAFCREKGRPVSTYQNPMVLNSIYTLFLPNAPEAFYSMRQVMDSEFIANVIGMGRPARAADPMALLFGAFAAPAAVGAPAASSEEVKAATQQAFYNMADLGAYQRLRAAVLAYNGSTLELADIISEVLGQVFDDPNHNPNSLRGYVLGKGVTSEHLGLSRSAITGFSAASGMVAKMRGVDGPALSSTSALIDSVVTFRVTYSSYSTSSSSRSYRVGW